MFIPMNEKEADQRQKALRSSKETCKCELLTSPKYSEMPLFECVFLLQ